jgi:flavin reductase (DIM6/NTAB) family NADH-FMN oxidoreductase RutF
MPRLATLLLSIFSVMSTSDANEIFWKVGTPLPSELTCEDLFLSCLVPRPTIWITVGDKIALLEGFNMCNTDPPTIMFGATALPKEMLEKLLETKTCTLSTGTTHQPLAAYKSATRKGGKTPVMTFESLGLTPVTSKEGYPPAVSTSPIHMQSRLIDSADLGSGEMLLFLEAEYIIVDKSAMAAPTASMAGRKVLAKIDCELVDPIVSMGSGRFAKVSGMYSMPRPKKQEDGSWLSTELIPLPPTTGPSDVDTVEYCHKKEPNVFGYNPVKSIAMPRPIGFLSTYRKEDRVAHLAPYSFFLDAGRDQPMVVFVGYRPSNGTVKKDAQTDTEAMGVFAWNVATEELGKRMNLAAAELEREGSEFELSTLTPIPARNIDAPVVAESPISFECEHIKSIDIGNWTCVVGKVLSITVNKDIVTDGDIDIEKLKPLSRCGYTDEYALFTGPL